MDVVNLVHKMSNIGLKINGAEVSGREGTTILEVAQENGIDIPTLCYHESLAPIGACRLCVVEVEGSKILVASCHTPIAPDMVIHTNSPKVLATRKMIIELLLAGHPDACIVCDKANICQLRQIAADLEVGLPRFRPGKRYYPIEDENPYVVRDLSKCILCRRCVRGCDEVARQNLLSLGYRAFDSKIVVDLDDSLNKDACRDCDVCISLCPTGALYKKTHLREIKKGEPLIIKA